jgi:hypothetical protein
MRASAKVSTLVVIALALVGAGCYGNTQEATNVGAHSAQLNAHGKADKGPAYTFFQYWKESDPNNKLTTARQNWPAGAEGSFFERPQHLAADTNYSYRLCGNDQGKDPVCANIKRFKTGTARSHITGDQTHLEFSDEPGVNSQMYVFAFSYAGAPVFIEGACADQTCGSSIEFPLSLCSAYDTGTPGQPAVVCGVRSNAQIDVKLGDLDDVASGGNLLGTLRIEGGPGDDSLNITRSGGTTLVGGPGRDALSSGEGNDTINARSANLLNPDTDASISCGTGTDTVIADRSDPISAGQNGCENVSKP